MEKKESAKERILRVADQLFYQEGIRAVGIDRIIAESGVAKASFYRSFPTKDDLVVTYLELRRQRKIAHIEYARKERPESALEQLRYLIDYLAELMKHPSYRGDALMNTIVEFPDTSHPCHVKALASRNEVFDRVADMAEEAGIRNPRELSELLRLLYSGASMVAYINKEDFKPELLSIAARVLIDSQVT
ncbi:TetR/AcrR family transcriptional regulator [Paenibacillus sp. YAF4_2]|uniref:TetR/AcrR family transcriptional regulator n=1 Tax=Paenibacillus sp. YAF4_2 TaxID=3233085 RepID=UPI003F99BB4D